MDLYADAKRYDGAIRECQAAIELADPERRPALRVRLSELQTLAGDVAGARKTLESMTASSAGSAGSSARLRLARLLINSDQPEEARTQLIQLASEDPVIRRRALLLSLRPAAGRSLRSRSWSTRSALSKATRARTPATGRPSSGWTRKIGPGAPGRSRRS